MIRGAIAIFRRDMKKFISTPYVIIFTLFMPIMYLIIFGNAMGGPSPTSISASCRPSLTP